MDIHPPEHPIRSVRDFLLQIFTITCGIVIALGLEALVTWRNDVALARVARADFQAELSRNVDKLKQEYPAMQSDFTWMKSMIAYGEAKVKHQVAKPPAFPEYRGFVSISNAAWDTALATQAIHHLRFSETRSLADAYTTQAILKEMTANAETQWITMAAYGGDLDELTDQEARVALSALRVSAAYTGSLLALDDRVIAKDKTALAELAK